MSSAKPKHQDFRTRVIHEYQSPAVGGRVALAFTYQSVATPHLAAENLHALHARMIKSNWGLASAMISARPSRPSEPQSS